jgi:hypothetical protein
MRRIIDCLSKYWNRPTGRREDQPERQVGMLD